MATPSAAFRVGPYQVESDARGIKLLREDSPTPGGSQALLRFEVYQDGRQSMPFHLQTLRETEPGVIEFGAMATDHEALDGVLTYREDIDGFDLVIRFVNATEDMVMRLGVFLELLGEADPHWLIPGLFYNDNRMRDCPRLYPSYSEIRRDTRKFVSNHWMFRADRAALPVAFCTTYGICAFLSMDETPGVTDKQPLGYGVAGLGFSSEEGHPVLQGSLPYIEEPVKYSYCQPDRTAPVETFLRLETNQPVEAHYAIGLSPIKDGGFGCAWEPVYRALYKERRIHFPQKPRLSASECQRLAVHSLTRWHLDEKRTMIHETSAFDKHFGRRGTNVERYQMHAGWMSGVLPAYVLLWRGREQKDAELVRAGVDIVDKVTSQLTPCGTLWPMITEEEGYTAGYGPEQGLAHSRTVAEAVLFLLRALRLEIQANTSHPEWFSAIRSNLDYIVDAQRDDGALPAYWRVEDGEVFSYDGSAGLCWVAPLAAFARLTSDKRYRKAAIAAGEYYSEAVESDFIAGSIEDLPLVPSSDDCHFAVISYVLLYEMERRQDWLKLAKRAADLALTYRMAYNVTFHPLTMLGQVGFQTRGGDISSVATPTLGPTGLVSHGEMLKLSAILGDSYYSDRAREARVFATQCLARIDGEYNAREGQALGQVFHTDWWQPKGMILSMGHAWCAAAIGYVELLERFLHIPVEAGAASAEDMAQAQHSAVSMMADEVILPDPAEVRRRKQREQSSAEDSGIEPGMDPSALVSHFTSRLADVLGLDDEPPPMPRRPALGGRDSTSSIKLPRKGMPAPRHQPPQAGESEAEHITPPPAAKGKTPLASRHTPLPSGDQDSEPPRLDEPTRGIHVDEILALSETPSPEGVNDPTPAGGILANLFDDDYKPPGSGGEVTDADRAEQPPDESFGLGSIFDSSDRTPKPESAEEPEDEQSGSGEDIKWKIF